MKRYLKCIGLACIFALLFTLIPAVKVSIGYDSGDVQACAASKTYKMGEIKDYGRTKISGKYFWIDSNYQLRCSSAKSGTGAKLGDYYYNEYKDRPIIVTNGEKVIFPSLTQGKRGLYSVSVNGKNKKLIHRPKDTAFTSFETKILAYQKEKVYFCDYPFAGGEAKTKIFYYNISTGKIKSISKEARDASSLGHERFFTYETRDPHKYIYDCKTAKKYAVNRSVDSQNNYRNINKEYTEPPVELIQNRYLIYTTRNGRYLNALDLTSGEFHEILQSGIKNTSQEESDVAWFYSLYDRTGVWSYKIYKNQPSILYYCNIVEEEDSADFYLEIGKYNIKAKERILIDKIENDPRDNGRVFYNMKFKDGLILEYGLDDRGEFHGEYKYDINKKKIIYKNEAVFPY